MSNVTTSPPFKIRSTIPGRHSGLKEWSQDELSTLIASYQECHPEQWQAYLEAESDRGFITNAMNDHIMAHIELSAPGLHSMHYRVGAVDFRFANERTFQFRMWQPENRLIRFEQYWSYVREMHSRHQSVHGNGNAEWTDDQVKAFVSYLRQEAPEFWTRICAVFNEFGFCDGGMMFEFEKQTGAVFAVPEDLSLSNITGGAVAEADRLHRFEMMKPENRSRVSNLRSEWLNQRRLTFDEWRRKIRERKNGLANDHRADGSSDDDDDDSAVITEEPGGEEFRELVEELQARYPAAPRGAIEDALNTSWEIGAAISRSIFAVEEKLSEGYQWPAHPLR